MTPIFNELISMWSDKGFNLPISEGKYWLDNNFIQAFTHDGTLVKLWKYKVTDDLTISLTPYKGRGKQYQYNDSDFETWQETLQRNAQRLSLLESESLSLIKQTISEYSDYDKYVLTSTGKDSMVVLNLVNRVSTNIPVVFNNTSLDCADTYKMVKAHKEWMITNPKEGFYQWIKRMNYLPTRFSRGCCTMFKERVMIHHFSKTTKKAVWFMGVRNDESNSRADREDITHNPKWGNKEWFGCLPIRRWTELEVWLYTFKYGLEINPKYRKGYRRVGCGIACPYASKYTWVLDEYWYPVMRSRWVNIIDKDFTDNDRWVRLNCTKQEYHTCWNGGLYRQEPTEEVVQEFMEHKGISDKSIALQYFNKACCMCGDNVRQSETIAMNLKIHGRNSDKIYCQKCLMKELEINEEEWNNTVADFKLQGCKLF